MALGDDDPPPLPVPADVASRCKPAPETARTFGVSEALAAALVGRWFRCRGSDNGLLYALAVEFTEDREWYELVDDGSGALVRSTDEAKYGVWAAQAPVTLRIGFQNKATQTLVVLFDPDGLHFSVARNTFDPTDVGYVHE